MKKLLHSAICFVLAISTVQTAAFAADKYSFSAKKAAVRILNPNETVECIVSSENENLFAYKAQLVYDKELFEFVNSKPVYLRGEPYNIKYMSENLPEGIYYNVPNSKVYMENDKKCGYFGEEVYDGMYRTISTIMGFEGRSEGNTVLKVTLKAKKAGDGFIYLTDEETSVLNDDKTVTANAAKTVFTVKTESMESGSAEIYDTADIAYPWRKSETAVFQQSNEVKNADDDFFGTHINVSYANKEAEFEVLNDGTVICSVPMQIEDKYTPVVAREEAFGTAKRINRIKYNSETNRLSFVVSDFGDYVTANKEYKISDCAENSEQYRAVCYLKSIGVVDEAAESFAPNAKITKAEFIKMLVCCMGEADGGALVWFKDVSLSDWYYKYIATAAKNGIISDDGENIYPNAYLNGDEAIALLKKASELINGRAEIEFDATGNVTRGEAAVAIQNMLWAKLK